MGLQPSRHAKRPALQKRMTIGRKFCGTQRRQGARLRGESLFTGSDRAPVASCAIDHNYRKSPLCGDLLAQIRGQGVIGQIIRHAQIWMDKSLCKRSLCLGIANRAGEKKKNRRGKCKRYRIFYWHQRILGGFRIRGFFKKPPHIAVSRWRNVATAGLFRGCRPILNLDGFIERRKTIF